MAAQQGQHGPTVRRRLLGRQLRSYRERAGVGLAEAAESIRASTSKVSRLETGQSPFRPRDVVDLLARYGVTDAEERAAVLLAARQASFPGWWREHGDIVPTWLSTFIDLEDAARLIRTFESGLVPEILQTEEYARAVLARTSAAAEDEAAERLVRLRMNRQSVLTRPDPPDLWVVLDEAALRRTVGGVEVMRPQLERLIATAKIPNVTVQILPFSAGPHAGVGGPFTLLRFAEPELPDVAFIERLVGGVFLDRRDEVDQYTAVMNRLSAEAATPEDTVGILTALLSDLR